MPSPQKYLLFILTVFFGRLQAQDFTFPVHEQIRLKNGLTVLLTEQKEVPLISVSCMLPAGSILDSNQNGVARLTAEALMYGTRTKSKKQFDEEIDRMGAQLYARAVKEYAYISGSSAAADHQQLLTLIAGMIRSPSFDSTELEKGKKRILLELEKAGESPQTLMESAFDEFLYGVHPYGYPSEGRQQSIKQLGPAALLSFHARYYQPEGSILSVAGNFDSKEMKRLLNQLFGDWKSAQKLRRNEIPAVALPPASDSMEILLLNKEDAVESTIYLGTAGVVRFDAEQPVIDILNTLLGGRFTSLLNESLRVNSGLTYGARSQFTGYRKAGSFVVSTFTETKNTRTVLDSIQSVLNRFREHGISENSLQSAKNYIMGQYPPGFETNEQLAFRLADAYWYGKTATTLNEYLRQVQQVTTEQVREAIRRRIPTRGWRLVIAGKASLVSEMLKGYGKLAVREIDDVFK